MIYRRKTYKIHPDMAEQFTAFFEQYLLPNQLKHGAAAAVRQDPLHTTAQTKRSELGQLYLESREDFLEPTGAYAHPRHIISVSGYITNAAGELLIVRTDWRSDTWELPGGQVEEGEEPLAAVQREIREETGITAEIHGLTGVYYNTTRGICSLVFRGVAVGGELSTSFETTAVQFVRLDESNVAELITRPHFRTRVLDAMRGQTVPYESFRVRPYELLRREE